MRSLKFTSLRGHCLILLVLQRRVWRPVFLILILKKRIFPKEYASLNVKVHRTKGENEKKQITQMRLTVTRRDRLRRDAQRAAGDQLGRVREAGLREPDTTPAARLQ